MQTMISARPTTPENLKLISEMFHGLSDNLAYLAMRWNDEKEYEDFAEYEKIIRASVPSTFTVLKCIKSPGVGFDFTIIGTGINYRMWAGKNGNVAWKRLSK